MLSIYFIRFLINDIFFLNIFISFNKVLQFDSIINISYKRLATHINYENFQLVSNLGQKWFLQHFYLAIIDLNHQIRYTVFILSHNSTLWLTLNSIYHSFEIRSIRQFLWLLPWVFFSLKYYCKKAFWCNEQICVCFSKKWSALSWNQF